ncbi:MAG TPA: hypothetical protein VHO48_00100 [Anaerolineaceae bacterium]|nr:hypothetical protein [Anaerolineaceae bacterium]
MKKQTSRLKSFLNIWSIGGGLILAVVLIGGFMLGMTLLRPPRGVAALPTAVQTVIAAPTYTPVVVIPTVEVSPTPTQASVPPSNDAVALGSYVQVLGTGGAGLRLRSDPTTASSMRLLALDSEVFVVKDGPRDADGFTWWYLENPYDTSKGGWAVSNFLTVIQKP